MVQLRVIARGMVMSELLGRFYRDSSGATAIEYGLIAAGIAVVIIAVVNGIGTNLNTALRQHLHTARISKSCAAARTVVVLLGLDFWA